MKFGKIELTEWTDHPQPDLRGYPDSIDLHRLFKTPDNEWKIGVSIRQHPHNKNMWYAMFYHEFSILHDSFPPNFEVAGIEGAKQLVDQFLLRMSKLTTFL